MVWIKSTHQSVKFQTFDCSQDILPNLYFHRLLLPKVYEISAKKSIEELCLMTLMSDENFQEKLSCFKNDMNLVNFDLNTQNSQNFYSDWFLLCKVYKIWSKKVQRNCLSWHWRVMQNLKGKLTCGLENEMRNMANLHQSTWKSQNWDFDGIL